MKSIDFLLKFISHHCRPLPFSRADYFFTLRCVFTGDVCVRYLSSSSNEVKEVCRLLVIVHMAAVLGVNKQSHEQGTGRVCGRDQRAGKVPVSGFKFCNVTRFPVRLSQGIKMVSVGQRFFVQTESIFSLHCVFFLVRVLIAALIKTRVVKLGKLLLDMLDFTM